MFKNKKIDKLTDKIIRAIYNATTEAADRLGELFFVLISFAVLAILTPFFLLYALFINLKKMYENKTTLEDIVLKE